MSDGAPLVLEWLRSHLAAHSAAFRVGIFLGVCFAVALFLSPHVKPRRR